MSNEKSFLPKAWFWHSDLGNKQRYIDIYVRLGMIMSNDVIGEIRDMVYVFPSVSFGFNHSEVTVTFAWLNFSIGMFYKNWKRSDRYNARLLHPQAKYDVGDTIEIIPTGKVATIKAITDGYYDFGYNENGTHFIADLRFPEQYRLYKPSLWKRIKMFFVW